MYSALVVYILLIPLSHKLVQLIHPIDWSEIDRRCAKPHKNAIHGARAYAPVYAYGLFCAPSSALSAPSLLCNCHSITSTPVMCCLLSLSLPVELRAATARLEIIAHKSSLSNPAWDTPETGAKSNSAIFTAISSQGVNVR